MDRRQLWFIEGAWTAAVEQNNRHWLWFIEKHESLLAGCQKNMAPPRFFCQGTRIAAGYA